MREFIFNKLLAFSPHFIKRKLLKFKLAYRLFSKKNSYLVKTGYIDSIVDNSLLVRGEYLPWFNFGFINFLKERLHKDLTVFEYGSGASTLFFAERVGKIISVEYDKKWYAKVNEMLGNRQNSTVYFQESDENYPKAIAHLAKGRTFDIIVIDGRKRVASAKNAITFLSEQGVLLFDDTQRAYYQEALDYYKENGFKSLTFSGLKPSGFGEDRTTLLYRANNCLGI